MTLPVVRCAPGVMIKGTPAGIRLLSAFDQVCQSVGVDLFITSGAEAEGRLPTDPHMLGEAFDLRVRDWPAATILAVYEALSAVLDAARFTVLFEGPVPHPDARLAQIQFVNAHASGFHFHCQRKKGTTFP